MGGLVYGVGYGYGGRHTGGGDDGPDEKTELSPFGTLVFFSGGGTGEEGLVGAAVCAGSGRYVVDRGGGGWDGHCFVVLCCC